MIVWKLACLVLIFDCAKSLTEDAFLDDDDLNQLTELLYRWKRAIHKFPEALWMLNSFPHFKLKHFGDGDLYPDYDENGFSDPFGDYDQFTESITNTDLTDEDYKLFSTKSDFSTIKSTGNFDGMYTTTTKLPHSDASVSDTNDNETNEDVSTQVMNGTDEDLTTSTDSTDIVTSDSWTDNDTDALVIEIVKFLKNNSATIEEIKELVKSSKSKCIKDLWYATKAQDNQILTQMLDAAGKPASGISRGNIRWLGDYRQCQDISVPTKTAKNFSLGGFDGLYCYASFSIFVPAMKGTVSLSSGICLPDSCSAEKQKYAYNSIFNFINKIPVLNQIQSSFNLTDVTCQDHGRKWSGADIVYIIILAVFAIFIVSGTTCDLLKNYERNSNIEKRGLRPSLNDGAPDVIDVVVPNEATAIAIGKERNYGDDVPLSVQAKPNISEAKKFSGGLYGFLVCFSVYSNASKVLTVGNQQGQISCLHGIRFLSLSWVIFGHVFIYALTSVGNIVDTLHDIDSFSFQVVSQATLAVDSFFLLSGLLLSFLYFKDCDKRKGKTNWIYYYVHRIWRLTPAFAMLLGFYATLWLHMGSGPLWPKETDQGNCRKSWWWNLLYIVNFHDVNKNCMGWTWYLANDMQFYIISPLFLVLLRKLPSVGIVVASIVTVASWILTGILSATNDFRLFMSRTENLQLSEVDEAEKDQWNFFNTIYDKPYCRIGPYLIGILVGYALYRTNGQRKFMKMWLLIVGWIVAAGIGISVVFGTYHVEMGNITAAFYNALSRSVWGMVLGWVIFVCVTGHADPVNRLLSWNFWIPLSRLTYCAYLIHPMLMIWYYSSLQTLMHFQMNTMVLFYFGYLVFAYLLAFIASMAFESPMMALEKLVLKKFSK